MSFEERIEFLLRSQESLHERMIAERERMNALQERMNSIVTIVETHEKEWERFRRAVRAGFEAWLNGENGDEQ